MVIFYVCFVLSLISVVKALQVVRIFRFQIQQLQGQRNTTDYNLTSLLDSRLNCSMLILEALQMFNGISIVEKLRVF